MREAVLVSSVRTAVGKAPKGTLRTTRPDDLAAVAIKEALARAKGLQAEDVEDVIIGCATPEAEQGMNLARIASLRAGLPVSVSAMTINRFCSSGLQSIALAAERIMSGQGDVAIAGGAESMSMVPMGGHKIAPNPWLMDHNPDAYINMGMTAENLAKKYGISRAAADEFSLASHQKALAAIAAGKFKDEIVPVAVTYNVLEAGANGSGNGSAKPKNVSVTFDTGDGRQQLANERRRRRFRGHERRTRPRTWTEAARAICGVCDGWRASGGNGHRSGLRHSEGAENRRPHARPNRRDRVERSVRGAGFVSDQSRGARSRTGQRQRRRGCAGPSARLHRREAHRDDSARA
jgi:Thiolase, N-terminal domain